VRMLTAALAAAAVLGGTATAAPHAASGLHGIVARGPTTPVCREGVPCHAAAVHVRISFVADGVSRTTTTDAKGRYAIALAPGTYAVRVAVSLGSVRPAKVVVRAGASRLQNLTVDTGIR
jgi:carboxypeptidase family protein